MRKIIGSRRWLVHTLPLPVTVPVAGLFLLSVVIYAAPSRSKLLGSLFPVPQSAAAPASTAATAQWEPARPLTGLNALAFISASDTTLHFAAGDGRVDYTNSPDEGATLAIPSTVANGSLYLDQSLIADGPNVYVVYFNDIRTSRDWCCSRPLGNIYMRISRDNGKTWDTGTKLTTAQSGLRVGVSVSGSNVYVVWMDYRSDNLWDLYFRSSADGGVTWQPEVKLVSGTGSTMGAERPQIVADGSFVHVTWMDGRDRHSSCLVEEGFPIPECTEIYYKRSADNGGTWDPDVRLTNGLSNYSGRPAITASNGIVLISFDHNFDDTWLDQAMVRSTDNGANWSSITRISSAPGDSTHSSVVLKMNQAHLVWFDYRDSANTQIFYRTSTDAGATWGAEELVSSGGVRATTPLLALTLNYLHVTWLDSRTGRELPWYRRRGLEPTSALAAIATITPTVSPSASFAYSPGRMR